MKKTIAILCDYEQLYPEMINVGCGGSETWAIEISNEFSISLKRSEKIFSKLKADGKIIRVNVNNNPKNGHWEICKQ